MARAASTLPRLLVLLLLLLLGVGTRSAPFPAPFQWYSLVQELDAVDATRAMPVVHATTSALVPAPMVVVARYFDVPSGLECYNFAIDVPLARRWPAPATAMPMADPGAAHFAVWQTQTLPTGPWAFASSSAYDTWTATMPTNRTWDPPRALGTYRFQHRPAGGALTYRESRYWLGLAFDLVNASYTQNWVGWAARADASGQVPLPPPFSYWDVSGNYLTDTTLAAQQASTTTAPVATAYYAGAAMRQVGLALYANCSTTAFYVANASNSPPGGDALPNVTDIQIAAPAVPSPSPLPLPPAPVPSPVLRVVDLLPTPSAEIPAPSPLPELPSPSAEEPSPSAASPPPAPEPVPGPVSDPVPSPSGSVVDYTTSPTPSADAASAAHVLQLEVTGLLIGSIVFGAIGLLALAAAAGLVMWCRRRERALRPMRLIQRETDEPGVYRDGAGIVLDEDEDSAEAVEMVVRVDVAPAPNEPVDFVKNPS